MAAVDKKPVKVGILFLITNQNASGPGGWGLKLLIPAIKHLLGKALYKK